MKKHLFMLTICALLLVWLIPGATAQESDQPACSEDELLAVIEAIEIYYADLANLDDISTGPQQAVYGAVVVDYDAFSYAFWNEVYPAFPVCAEAQILGFTVGLAYGDLTLAAAYANIAGWAFATEQDDAAEYFAVSAAERLTDIDALIASLSEFSLGDLPPCTTEESAIMQTMIDALATNVDELTIAIDIQTPDSIEAGLTALYILDEADNVFWNDVYPELPICAEAQTRALLAGFALDEWVLISALGFNGMIESDAGHTEIADALNASSSARFTDLLAAMTSLGLTDN